MPSLVGLGHRALPGAKIATFYYFFYSLFVRHAMLPVMQCLRSIAYVF